MSGEKRKGPAEHIIALGEEFDRDVDPMMSLVYPPEMIEAYRTAFVVGHIERFETTRREMNKNAEVVARGIVDQFGWEGYTRLVPEVSAHHLMNGLSDARPDILHVMALGRADDFEEDGVFRMGAPLAEVVIGERDPSQVSVRVARNLNGMRRYQEHSLSVSGRMVDGKCELEGLGCHFLGLVDDDDVMIEVGVSLFYDGAGNLVRAMLVRTDSMTEAGLDAVRRSRNYGYLANEDFAGGGKRLDIAATIAGTMARMEGGNGTIDLVWVGEPESVGNPELAPVETGPKESVSSVAETATSILEAQEVDVRVEIVEKLDEFIARIRALRTSVHEVGNIYEIVNRAGLTFYERDVVLGVLQSTMGREEYMNPVQLTDVQRANLETLEDLMRIRRDRINELRPFGSRDSADELVLSRAFSTGNILEEYNSFSQIGE